MTEGVFLSINTANPDAGGAYVSLGTYTGSTKRTPFGVAASPDGKRVYVTSDNGNSVICYNTENNQFSLITHIRWKLAYRSRC